MGSDKLPSYQLVVSWIFVVGCCFHPYKPGGNDPIWRICYMCIFFYWMGWNHQLAWYGHNLQILKPFGLALNFQAVIKGGLKRGTYKVTFLENSLELRNPKQKFKGFDLQYQNLFKIAMIYDLYSSLILWTMMITCPVMIPFLDVVWFDLWMWKADVDFVPQYIKHGNCL